MPSTKIAKILRLNRKTVDKYYTIFREKIVMASVDEIRRLEGEFELDESCLGVKRVRGKRGRVAAVKISVFSLLKRNGKVFVSIIKNCSREEIMPIIKGLIL